jgi:hypothetical protein
MHEGSLARKAELDKGWKETDREEEEVTKEAKPGC